MNFVFITLSYILLNFILFQTNDQNWQLLRFTKKTFSINDEENEHSCFTFRMNDKHIVVFHVTERRFDIFNRWNYELEKVSFFYKLTHL